MVVLSQGRYSRDGGSSLEYEQELGAGVEMQTLTVNVNVFFIG